MKNIHANTGMGSFPQYISINQNDDNENIKVTVREPGEGTCGEVATIELTKEQLLQMANDIVLKLSVDQESSQPL